jgi:cell division protein FtsQ
VLRAQLQKNPWVKDAAVRRAWPDRLVITLTEREPMAIWLDAPGGPALIDDEGVVLTQADLGRFGPMLAVSGDGSAKQASALIALLKGQPDIAVRVKKAAYVAQRRWDLVMDQGTVVKLPDEDAGLALARLARAQVDEKILDQSLKSIDLRQTDRIIIEGTPEQTRDMLVKKGDPA